MKIKRFDESTSTDKNIWVFICKQYDDELGSIEVDSCVAFNSKFDAVDHYINWVNEFTDESFEPMSENGERLFLSVDDNPDWEKCLKYVSENELVIELIEIPLK